MTARGGAEAAHQLAAGGKPQRVRLEKANAEIHVRDGLGIARGGRHTKIYGEDDDAPVGEMQADRSVVQPVASGPRAAMHFQHRGEGAGALRAVEAGEQPGLSGAQIFEVFRLN